MLFSSQKAAGLWTAALGVLMLSLAPMGCAGGDDGTDPSVEPSQEPAQEPESEPEPSDDAGVDDAGTAEPEGDGGTNEPSVEPEVELPPSDPQAACDAAVSLNKDEAYTGTTEGSPNDFIADCVGDDAADNVLSYTVTQDNVRVIVSMINNDDGDDLGVSVRTTCLDETTELGCDDNGIAGSEEQVFVDDASAGDTLFIVVDGYTIGDQGSYTVTVTEQTILAAGADCTPGDESAICDSTDGNACATDGDGTFSCQDPVAAKCEHATALTAGANSLSIVEGQTDDFSGSCTFFSSAPENVYTYTVTGDLVNVVATVDGENVAAGFARATCDDPASEFLCIDGPDDDNKARQLSAGDEVFVFIDGAPGDFTLNITEESVSILDDGITCEVGSDIALCNPSIEGLECLSVDDVFTCQVQTVLARGDLCGENDTGRVCDEDAGDFCLDNGGTFYCTNPLADMCEATLPTLTNTVAANGSTVNDVTRGECSFSSYPEMAFEYTVVGDRVNVAFATTGANYVYVRETCDDTDTEVGCGSVSASNEFVLRDVTAGSTYTVFVETSSAGDITVTPSESALTILGRGDTCDPDDINNICDAQANDFCIVPEDADMGTCTDVSVPNGTCDTATALSGASGEESGYLYLSGADYDAEELGDCTTYHSRGNDVVYSIDLTAGQTLNLSAETEADTSLFVLDACPPVADSCVAGVDSGDPEELAFTAETAGTYFIIVDTYTTARSGGSYSLTWSVE